jgi:hypothetical protein
MSHMPLYLFVPTLALRNCTSYFINVDGSLYKRGYRIMYCLGVIIINCVGSMRALVHYEWKCAVFYNALSFQQVHFLYMKTIHIEEGIWWDLTFIATVIALIWKGKNIRRHVILWINTAKKRKWSFTSTLALIMLFNLSFLLPNIRSTLYRETVIVKVDVSILMWKEIQMTLAVKKKRRKLCCSFLCIRGRIWTYNRDGVFRNI